jgi:glyoxylate reductase
MIVVTAPLPPPAAALLPRGPSRWWEGEGPMPRSQLLAAVADARGLLCTLVDSIDGELLAAAPQLEVVSQMAVGLDNIDIEACTRRGIKVGHTPGVLTDTTADTAMALLLAAVRRLPEGERAVKAGMWGEWRPDFLVGGDLHHSKVGIIGFGRIGQAIARRLQGFGVSLSYSGPRRKPEAESELAAGYRPLDDLLTWSDHVVVAAPLTDSTYRLIGPRQLQLMRSDATLINIARGQLIDTEALVTALREGWIARAALDVTDPEPLPPDHPLVGLPNCLVVPHLGSASVATREAMATLAVRNLAAGLAGEEMPGPANRVGGEAT